jgi:hypothetical protein
MEWNFVQSRDFTKVQELVMRMSKGGYPILNASWTEINGRVLYSLKFGSVREEEPDIHIAGWGDPYRLFEEALHEAHRRYRERVSA